MKSEELNFLSLGKKHYREVLDLQRSLREKRIRGEISDTILTVEHSRVITKGRRPSDHDFLIPPEQLKKSGYAIEEAGRGGRLTYHGPGQMVGYFIVSLRERKISIPKFVNLLEEGLIQTIRRFDVHAERRAGYPGVWVKGKKIGSIGLSIDRGVSMHGIALNVSPQMDDFLSIIPCGISDCQMTSLEVELSTAPSFEEVEKTFTQVLSKLFSPLDSSSCFCECSSPQNWRDQVALPGLNLEKISKVSVPSPVLDEQQYFHPILVGWLNGILKSDAKIDASAHHSLRATFLALNKDQQNLLQKKLGDEPLKTIFSLSTESDPKFFGNRFFALGQAFLKEGKTDLAASVFHSLSSLRKQGSIFSDHSPSKFVPESIQQQAQLQLDIINGTASILHQTEYIVNQTSHALYHPSPWLGLGTGMAAFKTFKGLALPFFVSGAGRSLISTQLGVTIASTLIAFPAEAYSFAVASRLGHHLAGTNVDGHYMPPLNEGLSSGVMLASMKGLGAAAGLLVGAPGRTALHRFYQTTVQQGATLGGIAMAHGIETSVGLRDPQPGNKTAAESFAMLGQFYVMNRFSPWMLGKGVQNYLRGLDIQSKLTLENGLQWKPLTFGPKKALASANSAPTTDAWQLPEASKNNSMAMAMLDGRNFPHLRMGIRSPKETIVHEEGFHRRLSADHLKNLLPNGKVLPAQVKDPSYVTGILDSFSITSHPLDIASFREGFKVGRDFSERIDQTAFDIDEVYLHWAITARGLFRGIGEKGKNATFRNTPAEFLNYEPFVSAPEARLPLFGKIWFGIQGLLKGRMRQHVQFHPGVRAFQLGLRLGQDKNLIMATTGAAGRIMILANEDPAMRMIYFGKGPEETVSIEEVRKADNIYTREDLVLAMRELFKEGNPLLQDPLVQDYIKRIQKNPEKGEKLKHPAIAILLGKRKFSNLADDSSSTFKMLKDLAGFSVLKIPSARPKLTLNFVIFRSGRYLDKMTHHYVPSLADSFSRLNLTSQILQVFADTPEDYPHQRFDLEISWQRYGREFNLPGQELKLLSKRLQQVGK